MNELSDRISSLSAEKRKALERLLHKQGISSDLLDLNSGQSSGNDPASARADDTPPSSHELLPGLSTSPAETKRVNRRFYNSVSNQLDSALFGSYSFFLNFGYVPDGSKQLSRVNVPQHYLNKNCVSLVTELIADCNLSGRRMLDVGCGRGGTVHVIKKFYDAGSVVGMDLSASAIAFCRRTHRYPGVSFLEGDAEQLPFVSESFDVVTNVESSHSYPNIADFYKEVFRILRTGGHFLYTDLLSVTLFRQSARLLEELGFSIALDRDITKNVLLSCDETARSHLNAFDQRNDSQLIDNFLGVPDSQVYNEMRSGKSSYRILMLTKRAA